MQVRYILNCPNLTGLVRTLNLLNVKGIVYPEIKIGWHFTQTIQDVDEFVSSSEQIWRNLALHPAHQWILCSERVPSE